MNRETFVASIRACSARQRGPAPEVDERTAVIWGAYVLNGDGYPVFAIDVREEG